MTEETSNPPSRRARGEGAVDEDERRAATVVEKLTACQERLFAYIYSVTGDADLAKDLLQETNRPDPS